MTDSIEDLKRRGAELYNSSANQVLAGFQILEELLKNYLARHFALAREVLGDRLPFNFKREDYQDAPLGRLIQVFAKTNLNHDLIRDLRAEISRRDHIAHKAFLKLYKEDVLPDEYVRLIDELSADMSRLSSLMTRLNEETASLR